VSGHRHGIDEKHTNVKHSHRCMVIRNRPMIMKIGVSNCALPTHQKICMHLKPVRLHVRKNALLLTLVVGTDVKKEKKSDKSARD